MTTPNVTSFTERYLLKRRASLNDNDGTIRTPIPVIKKQRLEDMFNLMLSDELVIKIFSYLQYKDLLLAAALVCRRWEHLSMDPDLWRSLDLCNMSDVTTESVEKLLERFERMKSIKLSRSPAPLYVYNVRDPRPQTYGPLDPLIKDSVIPLIAQQNRLQTLHLNCQREPPSSLGSIANCRSLQHLALSFTRLTDDALGMIGESCIKLIILEIKNCKITTDGLLPVIQHCAQLTVLDISSCEKVDDAFLIALAAKPSQIKSLDISRCNFTAHGLKYLRKLPKLTQFAAAHVESMCENVTSILNNLTYLWLEGMNSLSNEGVSTIVRNNPNLEILGLSRCETVDDTALEIISKSPCRFTLELLAFRYCSVSESGLIRILQNCTNLRTLYSNSLTYEKIYKLEHCYPHVKLNGD